MQKTQAKLHLSVTDILSFLATLPLPSTRGSDVSPKAGGFKRVKAPSATEKHCWPRVEAISGRYRLDVVPFKQADVSGKQMVLREAKAAGTIRLSPATIRRIRNGSVAKGDPLLLASLAGIAAAKKTPETVLLCHQLRLDGVKVTPSLTKDGVEVTVSVSARERTGVEMEALVAVTAALLNVWDAVKQYEKDKGGQYPTTRIDEVRVTSKVKRLPETV
jgi:cyclic pyranopterin phosphate synthase